MSLSLLCVGAASLSLVTSGCDTRFEARSNGLDRLDDGAASPTAPQDSAAANPPLTVGQVAANGGGDLDQRLRGLINAEGLTGDPSAGRELPSIQDPLAQLGMRLFFSKSLGGDGDTACASCHHPSFGGGDALALSVGTRANVTNLLGPGRHHLDGPPVVPRNSPTVFNLGLWDRGLFWDSRVESLGGEPGQGGVASGIRTPDVAFGTSDIDAGATLAEAQARFPVTSVEEMRGTAFEAGAGNNAVRSHLAARLGDVGLGQGELPANDWLPAFRTAFNEPAARAEDLVTYSNMALAMGEYERSMDFTSTPWSRYVAGDFGAISQQAKQGAIAFFRPANQGGAGCSSCHSGDTFTDEQHHVLGFPQIGPGKGDGDDGTDDFGRARETGDADERWHFRTPSLLNVALTAPYGHAGAYGTLNDVLAHYNNPDGRVDNYFDDAEWCEQDQFDGLAGCRQLYPNGRQDTQRALNQLEREQQAGTHNLARRVNLNGGRRAAIVAFLRTLTDDCADDPGCRGAWVPPRDGGPDGNQLAPVGRDGQPL